MKRQMCLFAFLIVAAASMYGQATRTWVSGVGDDANPCSRTAPCKTFAGAISKTAPGGEIDALDPGGFGALTITKSITLDGGGGQVASVLVAGTNGIVVAAQPTDIVIIRNMRFDGLLGGGNGNAGINGISWISGKTLHIENCTIFGFSNSGINIAKGDGVAGAAALIENTVVENNAVAGLLVKNTSPVVNVTFTHSSSKGNQFGIAGQDFSHITIFDSEIAANPNTGVQAGVGSGAAPTLDIFNSAIMHNGIGLSTAVGTTVNISGVGFFNNNVSIVPAGTINSQKNNTNTGTFVTPNNTLTPQ